MKVEVDALSLIVRMVCACGRKATLNPTWKLGVQSWPRETVSGIIFAFDHANSFFFFFFFFPFFFFLFFFGVGVGGSVVLLNVLGCRLTY